jgi:hypothetical protein
MADIIDTKYGTNFALAWTSADTKSANDLILKLVVIITTKLKVEMRLRQWKMKHGTPLLPSKRGIASLLNGPSYLAICVAKGNQAVSDCCHYTIFFARMGDRLHSSMTSVCTAPWGCSSGWTFGQLVLFLDH